MDKINPDHVMGNRSGTYEKVQGYDVLETGKSGLYLPIIPTGSESTYSVFEDGQFTPISKEEAYKYLRPIKDIPSAVDKPPIKQLIIDKIAKISGGGNIWINHNFKGKYLGPGEV